MWNDDWKAKQMRVQKIKLSDLIANFGNKFTVISFYTFYTNMVFSFDRVKPAQTVH